MSDFAGQVMIIKNEKGSLTDFLKSNFDALKKILITDSDADGLNDGHPERDKMIRDFLKYNEHSTDIVTLDPKEVYVLLFLRNSAGCFEQIRVIGYEYKYNTTLKGYEQIKREPVLLKTTTGSLVELHHQYFSMPS